MPRSPEGRMEKGGLPTCLCLLVSPSRDAPAWVSIYILAQIQMVEMNHTGTSSTAQICRQQESPLLEWVNTICVVSGKMSCLLTLFLIFFSSTLALSLATVSGQWKWNFSCHAAFRGAQGWFLLFWVNWRDSYPVRPSVGIQHQTQKKPVLAKDWADQWPKLH